jgi:phosphate/sulfate permease
MEAEIVYIGLAAVFGIFMAWGIGANDVANAMATSVGSKALTIKQAILVAAVFEFLGAVLAGGAVTSTIRKGIVDADLMAGEPGCSLRHATAGRYRQRTPLSVPSSASRQLASASMPCNGARLARS